MVKPDFSKIARAAYATGSKHSPEILTGIGLAGFFFTVVLAVKETPCALDHIHADSLENHDGDAYGYSKKEAFCSAWKCYIPAFITGVASTACILGANTVSTKRNAALVTAYTLSETARTEYMEKVVESLGEKKERKIHDSIAKDRMEKDPVTSSEVIPTVNGDTLCYDAISGRYFKSDIEKIRHALNEVNHRLVVDMFVSLNDFYTMLDLSESECGDMLGWNINDGLIDIYFSSQLADDGTPCLVVDFSRTPPKYHYERF